MLKPKVLYISIVIILIIPYVLAYSANSTNYKIWRVQEGKFLYNSTDEYKLNSAFYNQGINFNLNSTNYKTCEGFYCFITEVIKIVTPPGGGGGKPLEKAEKIICKSGEILVLINETYYCKTETELKKLIAQRDWRNFLIIISLILLFIYMELRRRRKNLEREKFQQKQSLSQ